MVMLSEVVRAEQKGQRRASERSKMKVEKGNFGSLEVPERAVPFGGVCLRLVCGVRGGSDGSRRSRHVG